MKNKLILLTVIMLVKLPVFANVFPLIRVEVQNKWAIINPIERVKLFINPVISDKNSIAGRVRINSRIREQQKNKDPFRRRQKPFWNRRHLGKGIHGINYTLGFSFSKKVIFRPREKEQ